MDRFVGDAGADAFLVDRVHERLAGAAQRLQRKQHCEHVPAVPGVGARRQSLGREQVVAREALEVALREPRAGAAPVLQVRELREAQPRRHVGEVVLDPRALHVARAVGPALDAVEAQLVHDRRLALVVEHEGPALDGGHVLVGMEAERHDVARRPHRAARGARSDREGRILEDADLMAFGESLERIGIERCVVMRRKQQARPRRDRGLRLRKIDVARAEVHVDEHGARAGAFDHVAGHEEALGGDDHLVARPDAEQLEGHLHRRRRGREGADRPPAEALRQRLFECRDAGSGDDPAAAQRVCDGRDHGLVDGRPCEGKEVH